MADAPMAGEAPMDDAPMAYEVPVPMSDAPIWTRRLCATRPGRIAIPETFELTGLPRRLQAYFHIAQRALARTE